MLSKYLTRKVEHITSTVFTCILLWATKLHIAFCNNPKPDRNRHFCYGLRTLIHSEKQKSRFRVLHCYNVAAVTEKPLPPRSPKAWWRWPSSPPSPLFPMGDVIGTESGYCMMSEVPEQMEAESERKRGGGGYMERIWREKRKKREREIPPPPIALLRETTRMPPWINFTRECSSDGRLIVRAERVMRCDYVECNREISGHGSGRVTMRLVPWEESDDDGGGNGGFCEECGWLMDEEAEEEESVGFDGGIDGVDEEESAEEEEFAASSESESESESERRLGVSYSAGELVRDSFLVGDGLSGCLGRPGSVPIRPMTPVM